MKTLKIFLEEFSNECNGLCMLKPGFSEYSDELIGLLGENGWKVLRKMNKKFSESEASEFYSAHKKKPFYNDLCKYISSGNCICFACHKDCKDPIKDMDKIKKEIRKKYSKDEMKNVMHSSDSLNSLKFEYKKIFDNKISESDDTYTNKLGFSDISKTIDDSADTIKSIILNDKNLGNFNVIVNYKDDKILIRFNSEDFKKDKYIQNIYNYFKKIYKNVKILKDKKQIQITKNN